MKNLNNKKVAILATNGFEESELFEPKDALEKAGANVHVVSLETGSIKAWNHGDWSKSITVDSTLDDAKTDDYDMLILPGGVINPDKLRREEKAVDFVRSFFHKDKLVAVICHGSQTMIEAKVVKGRKMTSFFSIKTDLINAGAHWIDDAVVIDNNLISSRNPGDLQNFNAKIIEMLQKSGDINWDKTPIKENTLSSKREQ
ncbi:MAG TPA: type 1 glutamine amidotransferase domain-containing protein [Prolixibacteraceae bacterium]|nr:type 1 glutamine amidotransferase domain-containing protein [Prolixibacteraceae bacterium]